MRVGAVQFRAHRTDLEGSRAALRALAERAAAGADLIVLPEMAVTGYVFADRDEAARVCEAAEGPTLAALAPIARTHGTWVVAGFPERDGDRLFNSALVIDPAGALQFVYRKTLLFDADLPWATPGDSGYRAFDTEAGRFGVGICMDLNDDRFCRWITAAQLDVVAFPTNWVEDPADPVDTWSYWAWRLGSTGAALVAANTWGTDRGVQFTGASAVVQGRTVRAHLPREGDGVLQCQVSSSSRRASSASSC
jgi:predicted amidohydrolase